MLAGKPCQSLGPTFNKLFIDEDGRILGIEISMVSIEVPKGQWKESVDKFMHKNMYMILVEFFDRKKFS